MRPQKYYVKNGEYEVLIHAFHGQDAVVNTLGLLFQVHGPAIDFEWEVFTVSYRGFRYLDRQEMPDELINLDTALDKYDHLNAKYDPFCESDGETEIDY